MVRVIYKNIPNYFAKKGICYISEFQGKKGIPILNKDGNVEINEFGEELEHIEYYITENSEEDDFETYNSIREFTKELFCFEEIEVNEEEIELFANTLFDMVDWQYINSLGDELIESWDFEKE